MLNKKYLCFFPASYLSDGSPGTELSLMKSSYLKLKKISKEKLVNLVSSNHQVKLDSCAADDELEDFHDDQLLDLQNIDESLALVQLSNNYDHADLTVEDVEEMLTARDGNPDIKNREKVVKAMKIEALRKVALKHIFPKVKKRWIVKHLGHEAINIHLQDGQILMHEPSTVFSKSDAGFYRTITFDYAHLINLFRESAAKGKLVSMGLSRESLVSLSAVPGFEYLTKIIQLQFGKLKFDSMNQKAAADLFSQKTVDGLKQINDSQGARCAMIIGNGLSAFDDSSLCSDDRIRRLLEFKRYLLEKNDIFERIRRPDNDSITNELFVMTLCSIDSHIFTYLNLEFFNPRRKSTSTVEMLFGQLMMMTDGYCNLDVRQLQDVLGRLTLSNAFRLLPSSVRGFVYLGQLKRHMKSYKPDDEESQESSKQHYPMLRSNVDSIHPVDSLFDRKGTSKKKRYVASRERDNSQQNVRKYSRKF